MIKSICLIILIVLSSIIDAQTISEKKASLFAPVNDLSRDTEEYLEQFNRETCQIQNEIRENYQLICSLYEQNIPNDSFNSLMENLNSLRESLREHKERWHDYICENNSQESYALWHQPETTLEQLVIDYGSQNYVYLMTPEVSAISISVDSSLPVPKSSWDEMLEIILTQNGIGIKELNPFFRQLYLLKDDHSNLSLITKDRNDLEVYPLTSRICFVLTPLPAEARRVCDFLNRFINPQTTSLQLVGRDILIIAPLVDVKDLLKMYDFMDLNKGEKEYRLISLTKIKAEEMAKMLRAMFDCSIEKQEGISEHKEEDFEYNGLKVILLETVTQGLFLVGTVEEICKAEEIIWNVESTIGETKEKTLFWYTVQHSDPEELADVLERVYNLMMLHGIDCPEGEFNETNNAITQANIMVPGPDIVTQDQLYRENFYQSGGYIVNPAPVQPGIPFQRPVNRNRLNFIVDSKTGSIMMVVEAYILPKIKDLLRKIDVPKKMVQLEVLLFEKRISNENNFGLNLLKIGSDASHKHCTSMLFNECNDHKPHGVFEFFISRLRTDSGVPAFDLAYKFLLAQDDVQINAAPSVTTVNQTTATIAIVDEISLNTGIFDVETAKGNVLKDAFTRAQYGIVIELTPTIHAGDECSDGTSENYITLATDITFDTFHGKSSRPDVTRRHIINEVRIQDGKTIILGNLRRKISNDRQEMIPFLGEIPGVGKLFSTSVMEDKTTEMFIFITPKIIYDTEDEINRIRQEQMCKRPGDIPEFLFNIAESQRLERAILFEQSLKALFGRPPEYVYFEEGEYDGKSCY